METKKTTVVRILPELDSHIVGELPARTAVALGGRRLTLKHGGRDVDRIQLAAPVPGYCSFKCLRAASPGAAGPVDPETYRDARIHAALEGPAAALAPAPPVAHGEPDAPDRVVLLGFWGSSHALIADHVALWRTRGYGVWAHVPAPGEPLDVRFAGLARFLAGARGRVVVMAMSNNGWTFLNNYCADGGRRATLDSALFVFDSAPHFPATAEAGRALLNRAQTAKVCQAFGEPPDAKHRIYRAKVEAYYASEKGADYDPFPSLVEGNAHVPKTRPTLFLYSAMDGVILDVDVEAHMEAYPPTCASCYKFATAPHIAGLQCRPRDYERAIDDFLDQNRAVE